MDTANTHSAGWTESQDPRTLVLEVKRKTCLRHCDVGETLGLNNVRIANHTV